MRPAFAIPQQIETVIAQERHIEKIARKYGKARDFLYLGRGINYPVALEGALKLKEISYIHAEGYSAGEMKHGPIALIDDEMPVVVIIPNDNVFDKTLSNLKEVESRNGRIIAITDKSHRRARRSRVGYHRRPCHQSLSDAGADHRALAITRLSHRGVSRHRRRSAAQPRQIRHRRIATSPRGPPETVAVGPVGLMIREQRKQCYFRHESYSASVIVEQKPTSTQLHRSI